MGLVVYKDAGANTVSVTNRMLEKVAVLQKDFPAVQVTVVAAQADFVVDALSNLGQEIVVGGVLSPLAFSALIAFATSSMVRLSERSRSGIMVT